MPRLRRVTVYTINIAANPHPEGIYPRLLGRAAEIIVRLRGHDFGKLTRPVQQENYPHLYRGNILVWTDIDLNGPWFDIQREEELAAEIRRTISIPENAKPNYRGFDYIFDERTHKLYFEAKNDLDQVISPNTALRLVQGVLAADALGEDWPDVAATLVPRQDAVENVLRLPGLASLYIKIVRPNPDGADDNAASRVWARLDLLHAHKIETKMSKAREAERLTLDASYQDMAEAAAENGIVKGMGRTDEGRKVEASTVEMPASFQIEMDRGESFLSKLLGKIPGLGRNPDIFG